MASFSLEEENYVRMSFLLSGICPRAARVLFDREFPPADLGATLNKESKKLRNLKTKRIINQQQWNLLFPSHPDVSKSDRFDISLIITLVRHLTDLIPPRGGYDCLPTAKEITPSSDLARIKYYRNFVAHNGDGKVDTAFFITAWEDLSGAIDRLGGRTLKEECDQLKIKPQSWEREVLQLNSIQKDTAPWNVGDRLQLLERISSANEFKTLLSKGTYASYENRVYLAGSVKTGKSTLASVLIGEKIPTDWKSTDGLIIHFGKNGIDLKERKMIPLKKGSAGHDVFAKLFRGKLQLKEQMQPEASFGSNPSYGETEESCTPVNQTETIIKSEKVDLESLIQEKMYQEILQGNYKMEIAPSDLVDFGGQKSYDMTHQLFIQCKGTFVLMFDGRYGLYDALEEYKPKKITTVSILKHWIDSILTYCVDEFVDEHKLPKILFAATHGDAFADDVFDQRKAMFIKELTKIFSANDLNEHIIYHNIFFFDARDQDDPEMQQLTKQLVEIAFEQPFWGQQLPVAWVPLELHISDMKTSEINFIRKSELQKINLENGDLALTDAQFEDFLKIQHSLGKLLYFGEHGIDNFIVVQPSAFVNVMRSFVTDEMFWPKEAEILEILPALSRTGVICRTDLYKLWEQTQFKHLVPSDDLKIFVTEVLIHLDILVERKQFNRSKGATEFLVPCMIKEEAPTSFLNMEEMGDKMICLSYHLKKSSVSAALIFKLIGSALNVLPIKEQDGRPCLYYQAAAFSIDDNNECRMHMKGNRIVINLINKVSRLEISSDIATSLQECLTFTLTNVLQFYYACIGEDIKRVDILKLFDTEVGVLCCDGFCFITLNEAKKRKTWTCEKKEIHETHLHWILDETIRQDECHLGCKGLPAKDLSQSPNDKHLVRLASELNISQFNDFLLHLGLQTRDWEKIEYNWGRAEDAMVVALLQWKERNQNVTFQKILDAQESIADNRHHLCQVFKGQPGLLENTSFEFQDTPEDRFLSTLSRKLGNCVIQLGIELGLTFSDIEAVYVKHPKDLFSQMYEVLKIWKQKTPENTYLNLMLAIQRVRGKQFLKRNFCCNI